MKDIKEIILIIGMIAGLALAVVSFNSFDLEKKNRIATEGRLAKEKQEKSHADQELSSEEDEREGLKEELGVIKQEAEALEAELVKQKEQLSSATQRIAELKSKTTDAQSKAETKKAFIAELSSRIDTLKEDKDKIAQEFGLLQKTSAALKEQLAQYQRGYRQEAAVATQTPPVATSTTPTAAIAPTPLSEPNLVGEVLTVNREFNFVVVSLGKNDGMKEGAVVDISRDNRRLAQASVETVRENISAATVVDKGIISQLRAGDKVLVY